MSDEKEILAKRHNSITEAIYSSPAVCQKLVFFTIAFSSYDEKEEKFCVVEATIEEVISALGITRGGTTADLIEAATKELMKLVYTVKQPNGSYRHFHWMEDSGYRAEDKTLYLQLKKTMKEYVVNVKNNFALIPLQSVGQLQGKYAIRLFDIVMTHSGHEGKDGNKPGHWYYEETVENLKLLFKVEGASYNRTGNFRSRVIDLPIQEINDAGIGIRITPVYIRKGKILKAVRLEVERVNPAEPKNVTPSKTETGDEIARMKAEFPKDWKKLFDEEMSQEDLFPMSKAMKIKAAEARTLERVQALKPKKKGSPTSGERPVKSKG